MTEIEPLQVKNQRVQLLLDLEATEVDHGEVRSLELYRITPPAQ